MKPIRWIIFGVVCFVLGYITDRIISGNFSLTSFQQPTKPALSNAEIKAQLDISEKLVLLHEKMGSPKMGDWLESHEESGQTFEQYVNSKPVTISDERKMLYIQPLGELSQTHKGIVIITADYLSKYFNIRTEILEPMSIDLLPDSAQRGHKDYFTLQLNTKYILNEMLYPKLPDDAAAYIAFTAEDLYPKDSWSYVFGQANLRKRVGVWSMARYGNPDQSQEFYKKCLLRTLKTASHETGHMFSIKHCIYYKCNMNGSNHLDEADSKPPYLCPVCMPKVAWNLGIDERFRFQKMQGFWKQNQFPEYVEFYEKSIKALE